MDPEWHNLGHPELLAKAPDLMQTGPFDTSLKWRVIDQKQPSTPKIPSLIIFIISNCPSVSLIIAKTASERPQRFKLLIFADKQFNTAY